MTTTASNVVPLMASSGGIDANGDVFAELHLSYELASLPRSKRLAECRATVDEIFRRLAAGEEVGSFLYLRAITRLAREAFRNEG